MSPTSLIIRSTTVLCSIAIIGLCIATFCKIGWATYATSSFPTEGKGRYGPYNSTDPDWDAKLPVYTLHYNWLPENFIWVATGISIVAAVLTLIVEAVRVFLTQRTAKDNKQGSSMAKGITTAAGAACTVACVASLVAAIYVNATHNELANKCSLVEAPTHEYEYTCTRELMSCKWGPALERADGFGPWEGYASACGWTIPLTLLSGVLAFGYGLQIWLGKRGQNGNVNENADDRVRRLQEEEE